MTRKYTAATFLLDGASMSKFVMFLSSWSGRRLKHEILEADSLLELLENSKKMIINEVYDYEEEAYEVNIKELEDRFELENHSYRPPKKVAILKSDLVEDYRALTSKLNMWCSEGESETRIDIRKY